MSCSLRAGAGAVHIVVAEDGNLLAGAHGVGQTLRRCLHVDQHRGVGQQGAQRRIEEVGRRL